MTTITEADYFRHDETAAEAAQRLARETDPAARAGLLDELAVADEHRAARHEALFGRDPNPDEDGRPHAESLASSAVLLRALAGTERALATFRPRIPATDFRIEEAAREVLDRLAVEAAPAVRAVLCDELYDVVEPIVGGQAAESIACQADRYDEIPER